MAPADVVEQGGTKGDHELRPNSKWYDKAPLGRLLVPGMSSYQENTERLEEKEESPSHKVGWRKPRC